MEQCKRILKSKGDIWSQLGKSRTCLDNKKADADAAPHPKPNNRWRRTMSKLRWRKNVKAALAPKSVVHGQKMTTRPARARASKLNYVNPLYYIRRIKNNLTNSQKRIPSTK